MNRKLLRLLTVVAVLTTTFALVMSASAKQALERVGNVASAVSESPNGIYIVRMSGEVTSRTNGDSLGRGQQTLDRSSPDGSRWIGKIDLNGLNRRQGIPIEVLQRSSLRWNRKVQILVHLSDSREKIAQIISP